MLTDTQADLYDLGSVLSKTGDSTNVPRGSLESIFQGAASFGKFTITQESDREAAYRFSANNEEFEVMRDSHMQDMSWKRLEGAKMTDDSPTNIIFMVNTIGGNAQGTCSAEEEDKKITSNFEAQFWWYGHQNVGIGPVLNDAHDIPSPLLQPFCWN